MDPLRVVLPDGVETGEEIVVTSPDGQEFTVTVPPGLTGGCEMDVDLPSAERESSPVSVTVTVFVPSGCGAGDEVTVDYEGETFGVVLPSGSSEGMPIDVELSLSHPEDNDGFPPAFNFLPCFSRDRTPTPTPKASPAARRPPSAPAAPSPSSKRPPMRSPATARPPPSMQPPSLPPPPTRFSTFCVGLPVEVWRSEGRWSRGTIDAVDDASCTCTLRMEDGRLKYLVEETELRHYRAGAFDVGDMVNARLGSGGDASGLTRAAIAGYDDDSATYSLLLRSGKRVYFVAEEEIAGGKLAAYQWD